MKVRNKPVEVEAIRYKGNNLSELEEFLGDNLILNKCYFRTSSGLQPYLKGISVRTLEGVCCVSYGDYIIKDVNGGFYLCKSDFFEQAYEIID